MSAVGCGLGIWIEREFVQARRLEREGSLPIVPELSEERQHPRKAVDVVRVPVRYNYIGDIGFIGVGRFGSLSQCGF